MKTTTKTAIVVCASLMCGCVAPAQAAPYKIVDVTMDKIDDMMEEKQTFTLLVEREGCNFCQAMNEYIEETKDEHNGIVVYHLDTSDFELYRENEGDMTLVSDTEEGNRLLEIFPFFLYTPAIYSFEEGKPVDGAFGYDETKHTVSTWNLNSTIDWTLAQNVPVWDVIEKAQ